MNEPLPPRQHAEQALGKAVTSEQLDELFTLHAAAHPVVTRNPITEKVPVDVGRGFFQTEIIKTDRFKTTVEIFSSDPCRSAASGRRVVLDALGKAHQNVGDQFNRRLGVTIAFGRALKELRLKRAEA